MSIARQVLERRGTLRGGSGCLEAISKLLCRASKILRFRLRQGYGGQAAQNDIEEAGGKTVTLSAAKGLGFETFETASSVPSQC